MKVSTTTLVVAAALGVSAHPSGFAHKNVHRQLKQTIQFVTNGRPQPPVEQQKAAVVPTPVTTQVYVAPTTVAKPAAPSGSGSGGKKKAFCGGVSKRATAADIAAKGNVGTAGNYGCNLMMVDNAADYDYTVTFRENTGKEQKCAVFLKISKGNGINGFFNGNQVIDFTLPANGKMVLAADADSQGGATCGVGKVPLGNNGIFAGTWLEFDFASKRNKGWSGADASCLTAVDSKTEIFPLKVCAPAVKNQKCSIINADGSGSNSFRAGMAAEDGHGYNVPPGPLALDVLVG
ncbi:allergen Asp F4-like protein [Metarhizium rileyi]|uniref:Allergen Asp F4-like protein n=1 Tax=Metarhizium rileyi (strain RCEF 4871) TaxID=1649241 RepID=A0A167G4N0_METRR|nr:allergen Asp F4-like protein [Metarhizium rileyi RCEF 4871]TWU79044.1 hypothetical protein ED733_008526 [Metarhizium rileyi]